MKPRSRLNTVAIVLLVRLLPARLTAADPAAKLAEAPTIGIAEAMGEAMLKRATEVREDLTRGARSLFEREPLGWDLDTLNAIYHGAVDLPDHITTLVRMVIQHSRVLGGDRFPEHGGFHRGGTYSLIGQRPRQIRSDLVCHFRTFDHPVGHRGLGDQPAARIPDTGSV